MKSTKNDIKKSKGGKRMKDFAKKFYNSEKWKACRQAFIAERMKIDGGVCQICGERPGYIVHHTVKLTAANVNDPSITVDHKRLQFVCKPCHDKMEGHWLDRPKKCNLLCEFDTQGDPIPPI